MRVQGSTWTIFELPACAFIGEGESLVVTDPSSAHNRLPEFYSDLSPPSPTPTRPRKWFLILSASILIVGLGFLGLVSWVMENDPRLSERAREAHVYQACRL